MFFENNKFMDMLTKFANMIIISVLWVLCSLPIITIGPATIALYYAAVKTIRHGVGYPATEFFKCMKENCRQGVLLSVINVLFFLFCYGIYHFSLQLGLSTSWGKLCYILVWMIGIFTFMTEFYLIAVISRFQVTFLSAVRLSMYFSITNLKTEVPMLLTLVGAVVAIYFFSPALFFLPGVYAFLMTHSVEKALIGYMEEVMEDHEQYANMWFMEKN